MSDNSELMSKEESIKWVKEAINGIKTALKDYNKNWVEKSLIRSEYLDEVNWEEVPAELQIELQLIKKNATDFLDDENFYDENDEDYKEDFGFGEHH